MKNLALINRHVLSMKSLSFLHIERGDWEREHKYINVEEVLQIIHHQHIITSNKQSTNSITLSISHFTLF
ncbi:hypothetical protein EYC80_008130 [Monilinia laxa]|uniref:Uncharacterized protein n=1 Tax=Monilinia laxa TaxID=61186 RepID=A0A5N6JU93_MONLA|nr:hypothetical protein EYC80_008130 [Monilinia laxa]